MGICVVGEDTLVLSYVAQDTQHICTLRMLIVPIVKSFMANSPSSSMSTWILKKGPSPYMQIIQSHHTHIDPTALRMQHHHQGPLRDVLGWSRRLALPHIPANARKHLACEERKKAHESNNSELHAAGVVPTGRFQTGCRLILLSLILPQAHHHIWRLIIDRHT